MTHRPSAFICATVLLVAMVCGRSPQHLFRPPIKPAA
jgi:hypothetical protein